MAGGPSKQDPSLLEWVRQLGVPVEVESEPLDRTVTVNGLLMHFLDWGNASAPTMLLVHGGSTHAHIWDLVAPAFARRYHVVAPDLRGHGDSAWAPDGAYHRAAHISDLEQLVATEKLAPLVLVGHSMGGNVALGYAAQRPQDILTLVLVDSGPGFADDAFERANRVSAGNPLEGSFESFVERVHSYSPHWPPWQVRWQVRHSLRPLSGDRWTWKGDPFLRSAQRRARRRPQEDVEQLWAAWDGLQCDTLIVRGGSSRMFRRETAERLLQRLPAARFVEVPRAGHRVPEDNPADFVQALNLFL